MRPEATLALSLALLGCPSEPPLPGDDTGATAETEASTSAAASASASASTSGATTTASTSAATSDATTQPTTDPTTTTMATDDTAPTTTDECDHACDPLGDDCGECGKCMPIANDGGAAWNENRCRPIDGNPAVVGEPCTVIDGVDDCDETSMCFGSDADAASGFCVPFCASDRSCESPDDVCLVQYGGVLTICVPLCDPLLQDCEDGSGCYSDGDDGFGCVPAGSGFFPAPCENFDDCSPGVFCAEMELVPDCATSHCCSEFCDVTEVPDVCSGTGQECVQFTDSPPPGFEDVGLCVLP